MVRLLPKWKKLPELPDASFGERLADHIASFGGSWAFIVCFFTVMAFWIVANSVQFLWVPWDRPPFILFNLILSMLAAIQAPIIMMSQNRREIRDRQRDDLDLEVDIKAQEQIQEMLNIVKEIQQKL